MCWEDQSGNTQKGGERNEIMILADTEESIRNILK